MADQGHPETPEPTPPGRPSETPSETPPLQPDRDNPGGPDETPPLSPDIDQPSPGADPHPTPISPIGAGIAAPPD